MANDDRNSRRIDMEGLVHSYQPSHERRQQTAVPVQTPRGVPTSRAPDHPTLAEYAHDTVRDGEAPPAPPAVRGQERAAAPAKDTVILSVSVMVHNEPVNVIKFRRPGPADLRRAGYPFRNMINPDTRVVESIEMNADAIFKYIVCLSDPQLPTSSVESMSLRDFENCTQIVLGFFQE